MKNYPKGTTEAQWKQYEADLKEFEERMLLKKPEPQFYLDADKYDSDIRKWKMESLMDAPNEPGYYRANND